MYLHIAGVHEPFECCKDTDIHKHVSAVQKGEKRYKSELCGRNGELNKSRMSKHFPTVNERKRPHKCRRPTQSEERTDEKRYINKPNHTLAAQHFTNHSSVPFAKRDSISKEI
jgi:hypothetical protein